MHDEPPDTGGEADLAASREALRRAIAIAGTEAELARRLPGKIKSGHIYYWRTKAKRGVPADHCADIAAAVGQQVTAQELRRDVFGERGSAAGT